ncbi:MAG: helix-turn-helix domain-containing protein, partial [Bacteroidaceae bacterium]|nr:helix-turn-helix domain-containing protein [Bacteroidaceae bacterium]
AMLKAEGDSVKNVCNRLNFANQSFFAKYFKQHTGMTPREYKNK